jgi:hypothetical protein
LKQGAKEELLTLCLVVLEAPAIRLLSAAALRVLLAQAKALVKAKAVLRRQERVLAQAPLQALGRQDARQAQAQHRQDARQAEALRISLRDHRLCTAISARVCVRMCACAYLAPPSLRLEILGGWKRRSCGIAIGYCK